MDERLFFPATLRNRAAIGEVLDEFLPHNGITLEIASGSGEHGVTFQKRFPNIIWQTSDSDQFCRRSINSWIRHERLTEKMPLAIDLSVEKTPWPLSNTFMSKISSIVCINLIHIAHWDCTQFLFKGSEKYLKCGSPLILYGPFKRDNVHTAESNAIFDRSLKSRNKHWGIRNLETVDEIAKNSGFKRSKLITMPANNFSVIFHRT